MAGVLYGVGVGPGDPELLTVKAVNVIKQADVILAPKTEKKDGSAALSIAKPYIDESTQILELVFPMVYNREKLLDAWENNKKIINQLLDEGKKVVFLTLGDPMLYSTFIYIQRLLEGCGHSIKVVPGVTSFSAIGGRLNYPLAEGNDILCVVPATIDEKKLEEVMSTSNNLVLLKVYKNYKQVVNKLKQLGLIKNAVMVSKCGLEGEKIVTDLEKDGEQKVNYLSTILVRRYLNKNQ
ncbi:precorrin-2/cobalt-factor-2 C20-methyltransferase [Desulfohalotomaculum tongense]|uniref:precorrin-2 C(20)-methyltransferase n=1 Tax=Desulforadius tongensis TaxID=1216062 RepID=UPI001958C6F1|nr:precorrin-2 C(20)-methyltransferase [Desulforadius tongensis]MBM7854894.1 precorrin-2/cobalt-factor-2 C20-methyltransferase [Desulforadius tongensis]